MKNANMLRPSQVSKFIAMTIPKNAPAKCKAKYNAQNSSFIISSFKLRRLSNEKVKFNRLCFLFPIIKSHKDNIFGNYVLYNSIDTNVNRV